MLQLEPGNTNVTPYLTIEDAPNAILYYRAVFDADVTGQMMAEDGKRVTHATVKIGDFVFMMSSAFPEFGGHMAPDSERGSPVAISLRLATPTEVDRIYAKALEHGGSISAPPQDMFWGDRFAQVIDCAGHRWMLAAKL
ncbi:MAG: VOC family protein [Pseudomonadota bacterium]